MASSQLDSYFDQIINSEGGEEVRDAIINAAKNLQKLSSNTYSLNGIPAENFATSKEYLEYYVRIKGKPAVGHDPKITGLFEFDDFEAMEDDSYAVASENVMTSGNLYAILVNKIRPSLSYIMHYENDPQASDPNARSAIQAYIDSLYEAKRAITKALKSKGYQDPETFVYKSLKPDKAKDFREFAELIHKIGNGTPELISGGTFDKQKEYDAGDGRAYTSFKIQCDDFVQSETFNENKTYSPDAGKLFAKTINVNVNTRSSVRSGVGGRTTGSGTSDITDDGFMQNIEIVENGTWSAADMGANGWLSITTNVSVPDVTGKEFTVNWMCDGKSYGSSKVEAYGVARFEGDTDSITPPSGHEGEEFWMWEPSPVFVVSDMTCEAKFKPRQEEAVDREIDDDWATICSTRGAAYEIGEYKTLSVGNINGYNYGNITFQKVAEGEDSTTSTWVSKSLHSVRTGYGNEATQWPDSSLRAFLNGKFINDLNDGNTDCQLVAKMAVPVRKKTLSKFKNCSILYSEMESIDTFWIPSAREMLGPINYDDAFEVRGKLYFNGEYEDGTFWDPTGHKHTGLAFAGQYSPPAWEDAISEWCFIDKFGKDYATTAYGGCVLTTNLESSEGKPYRYQFVVTPNDPTKYQKAGLSYGLRTFSVGISNSGLLTFGGNGDYYIGRFPIGFCM